MRTLDPNEYVSPEDLYKLSDDDRFLYRIKSGWAWHRTPVKKPTWDESFMGMAYEVAKRSADPQTQVGAYLTNDAHEPISCGYNGYPRGVPDNILPNVRPPKGTPMYDILYKYAWMIHSEANTILNAARQGKCTLNTTLYGTHPPCERCTLFLWQAGVKTIIYDKVNMPNQQQNKEYEDFMRAFNWLTDGAMLIHGIDYKKQSDG